MSEMYWPLMKDCITDEDKKAMSDFVMTAGRFTNGPRVKQFEEDKRSKCSNNSHSTSRLALHYDLGQIS